MSAPQQNKSQMNNSKNSQGAPMAQHSGAVLRAMMDKGVVMAPGAFSACFSGSKQMPAYGLNWWLNAEITDEQAKLVPAAGVVGGRLFPSAPADTVAAAGAMDSRLYIIPSLDLVIVRMGGGSLGWKDDEFLAEILAGE